MKKQHKCNQLGQINRLKMDVADCNNSYDHILEMLHEINEQLESVTRIQETLDNIDKFLRRG